MSLDNGRHIFKLALFEISVAIAAENVAVI